MCRFSAFLTKSAPPSLENALFRGENSLARQSRVMKDGYGLRWIGIDSGRPSEVRGTCAAWKSDLFAEGATLASGTARGAVAHARYATQGETTIANTHPFSHGNWTFAHNGNVARFLAHRGEVLANIDPAFHGSISGQTDSEHAFYAFLTQLGLVATDPAHATADEAARALGNTVQLLGRITNSPGHVPSAMNFVALSPETLAVSRYNRQLVASDRMGRAPQDFALEAGAPMSGGLALASEPYQRGLGWSEVPDRSVLAVDLGSGLVHHQLDETHLPLGRSDEAVLTDSGWTADA